MARKKQTGVVDADTAEAIGEKATAGLMPEWFGTDAQEQRVRDLLGLSMLEPLGEALLRYQSENGLVLSGEAVEPTDRTAAATARVARRGLLLDARVEREVRVEAWIVACDRRCVRAGEMRGVDATAGEPVQLLERGGATQVRIGDRIHHWHLPWSEADYARAPHAACNTRLPPSRRTPTIARTSSQRFGARQ